MEEVGTDVRLWCTTHTREGKQTRRQERRKKGDVFPCHSEEGCSTFHKAQESPHNKAPSIESKMFLVLSLKNSKLEKYT